MRLKQSQMFLQERPREAHCSHVAQVQQAVSSTDGRTWGHICTHHCWQSEWLHKGCCRWKDSGMGRCASARCGWQKPAAKPHCEAPLLKAQCQAALLTQNSQTRRAEGSVKAKVAIPPAGSAHLSLGEQNHVQKSMFSKVITQVFPSEVLTEVLSMLRTRLPNGKCPHGGF